jgi:superfamily II DNA or RNA helicase
VSAVERRATVTILNNTRCVVAFRYPAVDGKIAAKERTRIVNLLDDALAIEQKGAHFNPTVQQGLWDGRRHMFYKDGCTFPKGIMPRVKRLLREAGYKVMKTKDERKNVHGGYDADRVQPGMLSGGIELRPDQIRVINAALEYGCGLMHCATGAGKTEIGSAIIKVLTEKRCLFLVHTKQLLKQARERIAMRLGTIEEHIGVIGDGRFEPKHITIATVQSLGRARGEAQKKIIAKYLKSIELLILDEVHHASAKTFYKLVQRIDAPWRYGMSGTPFGLADGKGLMVESAFGPVVERVTNEELIALGVNAKPTIHMIEVDRPEIDSGLDWQSVYKEGIVLNSHRNMLVADWAKTFAGKKWPTLVLVRELLHGDNICTLLRDRQVPHAFVHGQMSTDEVERQKVRLTEGKIRVLIASPIFGEGVDIPSVRALIVADGGQSTANVLQKIGRGLRRKADDNRLDVIDFADITHKWLSRHSQERLSLYLNEGFEVITV